MISKKDKSYFLENARKPKTPKELAKLYIIYLKDRQGKMKASQLKMFYNLNK